MSTDICDPGPTSVPQPASVRPAPLPSYRSPEHVKGSSMLRVAVPNKGSLSEPASDMLREAGYRQRRDSRELVLPDRDNDIEFFFLRPRDIAVYVGGGTLDVGITGRVVRLDSGAAAEEVVSLRFGRSTFRF